jgi:hypothetical protein
MEWPCRRGYLAAMTTHDKTNKRDPVARIRLVEGVLRRWDPVGVQPGRFAPAEEYDSYAPQIVCMVESGCSADALVAHLEHLSVHTLGVDSNLRASTKFAAEILRTLQPFT